MVFLNLDLYFNRKYVINNLFNFYIIGNLTMILLFLIHFKIVILLNYNGLKRKIDDSKNN